MKIVVTFSVKSIIDDFRDLKERRNLLINHK